MQWWHVQFHVSHEAADAVAGLLQDFSDIQGVQIEGIGHLQSPHPEYGEWFDEMIFPTPDVVVSVYFPASNAAEDIRSRVLDVLQRVSLAGLDVGNAKDKVRLEAVDDTTWLNAWEEYYEPIPLGENLVIVPIRDKAQVPAAQDGSQSILLEPGMAFGTGTHQTTQMCVEALAKLDVANKSVLDVGTGTGILAIAAAKLGAAHVTAIDIDPVAVRAAKDNVETNALLHQIEVREGNLLTGFVSEQTFEVVIANILRDIVIHFIPQAAKRMTTGSHFLCSGFIDTQSAAVESALRSGGFVVERRLQKDDWIALLAVKS